VQAGVATGDINDLKPGGGKRIALFSTHTGAGVAALHRQEAARSFRADQAAGLDRRQPFDHDHVDRLVADGIIRGFTIQVDPAIDGMSTEAYVELFCRGTVAPDDLLRILSGVPEVVDAGTVTGSADAIVHIRARDIPGLEAALEKVRLAPNVDHTRSAIVLSRLIHRAAE